MIIDTMHPNARVNNIVLLTVLIIGFSGLVAQVLLLRELLIVFGGNELLLGVIMANWLVLSGLGSLMAGKWVDRIRTTTEVLAIVAIVFSLSLPLSIYLTRALKNILDVAIGEGLGFVQILYSTTGILLPVSIANGALFTLSCKVSSAYFGEDEVAVTKVYVYSTFGTVGGGIAWTYLLLPYFNALQIVTALAVFIILSVFLLLYYSPTVSRLRQLLLPISGFLVILCGSLLASGQVTALHSTLTTTQWKPLNVLHNQNSVYGNIVVTELEGQITFFLDGLTYSTMPIPDIVGIEEFVHTPMFTHPNPQRILVLGKGAGGKINTVLKHPVVELVDYVELDPLLISLKRKFPVPMTQAELDHERVRIKHIDGRRFLLTTENTYDLILLGASDPSDMRSNRYFTKEFFALAERRLDPNGILVLAAPGSLSYPTDELRNLNSSILHTLRSVFPYVRAFPQQDRIVFFASDERDILHMDNALLLQRLSERDMNIGFAVPWHIERMLHPGWNEWFAEFIAGGSQTVNRDFMPRAVFYSLAHWSTRFAWYLRSPFQWMQRANLATLSVLSAIIAVSLLLFKPDRERALKLGIPISIATTGFAGMTFDLILIFAFQAIYGFVFSWIGLIIAAFMTGIAVGAMMIVSFSKRAKNEFRLFKTVDLSIVLFSLFLALILILLRFYSAVPLQLPLLKVVFLLLSLLSGILVGAQFPLANLIYSNLKGRREHSGTAGLIYGADLLGGGVGGIIVGVLLLPIVGLIGTCILVALIKLISFAVTTNK